MLDSVEKSKLAHVMNVTPSTTFPHPISKHLDKLSEQELGFVKKNAGQQLVKMHYARQLEDIFELYDCYDVNDGAEKLVKSEEKYFPLESGYNWLIVPLCVSGFLLYKKQPLFQFSSYLNNIYAVSYVSLLSYSYARFIESRRKLQFRQETFCESHILGTSNLVHVYNTNLINSLRFNANEAL